MNSHFRFFIVLIILSVFLSEVKIHNVSHLKDFYEFEIIYILL